MMRQILIVLFFIALGFAGATELYFFATGRQAIIVTPLARTKFSLVRPPSASLVGEIAAMTGKVGWESRTANDFSPIAKPQKIQQGEALSTGPDGSVTVVFSDTATISALPNTTIHIVQTLPVSLVIKQTQGTVLYASVSQQTPISVRGLDLLVSLSQAQASVSVNKDTQQITIRVTKGNAMLAYTDTNNTSQVTTISSGKTVLFDNNTKTLQ